VQDTQEDVTRNKPIRILLLDHHALVRQGFRLILEKNQDFSIVGESGSRASALDLATRSKADIILLELNLDGNFELDVIDEINQVAPNAKIILVTALSDARLQRHAVQSGVVGIVSKKDQPGALLKAVEKVYAGEVWIDRVTMAKVLKRIRYPVDTNELNPDAPKIAQLSDRERQVIALIGEGMKNKDIAERLSISEYTVRHHLTSIYSKLEVADRLELLIFSYRNKLVDPH
jgi:DNA-binding NarL/FixJ family response regulator